MAMFNKFNPHKHSKRSLLSDVCFSIIYKATGVEQVPTITQDFPSNCKRTHTQTYTCARSHTPYPRDALSLTLSCSGELLQ